MNLTTRILLWSVLGVLSAAALAGIATVALGSSFNSTLLALMLTCGMFGLTSLGASVVHQNSVSSIWRGSAWATWAVSGVGTLFYAWAILADPSESLVWRGMGAMAVVAVALPHLGLLSLTRFQGALRFVRLACLTVVGLLAFWLVAFIMANFRGPLEDLWQVPVVLGILTCLGTVGLPVLHRLAGTKVRPPVESAATMVRLICPRCLSEQTLSEGRSACASCDLRFEIRIEEPRCPGCGYLLYRLTSPRCPECGRSLGTRAGEANGAAAVT